MPPAPSRLLEGYARNVLRELGIPETDEATVRRVMGFIQCNGYPGVIAAARETAATAKRRAIAEPWDHARGVFNEGLARANLLHALLHLAETALRAWTDLRLEVGVGARWHLQVYSLLDARGQQLLDKDWGERQVKDAKTGRVRLREPRDFTSGAEFLESISFATLRGLIRCTYGKHQGLVLTRGGIDVPWSALRADLEAINTGRNEVAHCRTVARGDFNHLTTKLIDLLEVLRFDVEKTVYRTEIARYRESQRVPALRAPIVRAVRALSSHAAQQTP
jgi:hypothetical protein